MSEQKIKVKIKNIRILILYYRMRVIIGIVLLAITRCLVIEQLLCSRSNSASQSTYTILLTPSLQILQAATLRFQFPPSYDLSLAPTSNSSFTLSSPQTLSYTLPSVLRNITYTFSIPSIINPSIGSSGVFAVRIYQQSLLMQENLTAGMVGIGPQQTLLVNPSVYLDPASMPAAGEIAYYNFVFTLNASVQYPLTIQLKLPGEFVVPSLPTCSSFAINSQSNGTWEVGCYSNDGSTIVIENYQNGSLRSGSRVALKVSLLNPNRTGTTGTFSIYVYKSNTTYVVSSYENIAGVTIQHGLIYSAQWTKYNPYAIQAINKTQDYLLSFTPKNPLSKNNTVIVDIPNGFTIVFGTSYDYVRVIQGITGGTLTWDNYQIIIANGKITGNVKIIMRLVNPLIAGQTNTLTISTYDTGILVDQNSDLSTTISQVSCQPLNIFSSFSITFSTLTNISLGSLLISNLQVNNPSCQFSSSPVNCYSLNGQIFIGSTYSFQPLSSYSFTLTNLNYDPGTYLVDYQITSGSYIQSSTAVVIIPPRNFANAALQFIDGEISIPPNYSRRGILNISFTTDYEVKGLLVVTTDVALDNAVVKIIKGLVAPKGDQINILFLSSTQVQISNFVPAYTNTFVEIHVANPANPLASAIVNVQIQNQLETTLSLIIYDSISISVDVSKTPTIQNGYSAIDWNMSSGLVGTEFSLIFQPFFNGPITNSLLILELPGYDTMFIRQQNVLACKIDGVFYPCISYPKVDWILIQNISSLPMVYPNGSRPTITIYGLQWPTYADTVGYLMWRALDQTTLQQTDRKTLGNIIGNSTFPTPNTTNLSFGSLSVTDASSGSPGVTFSFVFTTATLLPGLSSMTLSFPPSFSLNTSSPLPSVSCPMFSSYSPSQLLTISILASSIVFTNISPVPPLSTFTITIKGVKMPTLTIPYTESNFSITVTKNSKLVTSLSAFDRINFAGLFTVDQVQTKMSVERPVVDMVSEYVFELTPYHSIPKQGIVKILFPFNLSFMGCGLQGSISNFQSCAVDTDNKTLLLVLGEDYYTGAFNITLEDVVNPSTAQPYAFSVSTFYDNTLMDSSTSSLTLYSVSSSMVLSVVAIPSSQGEWATFNLSATLTKPADTIVIELGNEFASTTSQIAFPANYSAGTYYLIFSAFNPSVLRSAKMSALSWAAGVVLERGDLVYTSQPAAQWLELYQYSLSDQRVGSSSTIQLSMNIPSLPSTGSLQIQFSSRFDCTYSSLVSSSTPLSLTSSPALLLLTSSSLFSGPLTLNISLLNPNISSTYSFSIRIRDSLSILSKTFENLDFVKIPISDIGPGFWVDNNQTLLVYENTLSGQFVISVAYPSRYAFTVQAVGVLEVIPNVLEVGRYARNVTFRVKAKDATPGTYLLKWQINSTDYHGFYNPIPQTLVTVQPCPVMSISVQPVNSVPIGGSSLPLSLALPFLPTSPLTITLTPVSSSLFLFTPLVLPFPSVTSFYTINSTAPLSSSSFFSGATFTFSSDHPNFTISSEPFTVVSLPLDQDPPFISELKVVVAYRDSVVVSVGLSELGLVSLVVKKWYETMPQQYGWTLDNQGALFATQVNLTQSVLQRVNIGNLTSDGHYIVYCMAVDRGNLVSQMRSLQIETLPHSPAVQALIPFSQPNLTVHQQNTFLIPRLTFYLSLPDSYVLSPYSSTFYTSPLASRYISGVFYQPLWIIIPDSYMVGEITQQLSSSRSYLQSTLPYVSTTTQILTTTVNWTIPNIVNVTYTQRIGSIQVNTTTDDYGSVFVSVFPKLLNYSYQVKEMANCTGVMTTFLTYSCNVAVQTNTDYTIHVALGDIGPLFPTLNPNFTTTSMTSLPAEPIYHLNINSSPRLLLLTLCWLWALV